MMTGEMMLDKSAVTTLEPVSTSQLMYSDGRGPPGVFVSKGLRIIS